MKTKYLTALGVAAITALGGIAGAALNTIWGSSDSVNIFIEGEKITLNNQDIQEILSENNSLKEENGSLKIELEYYERQIEDLKLENKNLVKLKEETESNLSDEQLKEEKAIWDILPTERLNATNVCLPSEGKPFIMSGRKCYGVYIEPSWGGNNNIYLYLNQEFSDVSFKIGHIDKTYERDVEVKIFIDGTIYEEPYTITYSEQPREFNISGLENVGTLLINIDNYLDGTSRGPSYGITDIYLNKI